VYRRYEHSLQKARNELQTLQGELDELTRQILTFETQVDSYLGDLLDQLSELNAETLTLNEELRHIRDQRLFGAELMRYLDGAPRPARPINLSDIPPMELHTRNSIHLNTDNASTSPSLLIPDIKKLYRKLAHRYHPDLVHNDVDRQHANEQMAEVNQVSRAGDLPKLMKLAGLGITYGMDLHSPPSPPALNSQESSSELTQVEHKINQLRQQITRLSNLPIIKLSLEVKLARHQRRDRLRELEAELRYKVARKVAERDYLRSQIKAFEDQTKE